MCLANYTDNTTPLNKVIILICRLNLFVISQRDQLLTYLLAQGWLGAVTLRCYLLLGHDKSGTNIENDTWPFYLLNV